jgi:hypothetical protein
MRLYMPAVPLTRFVIPMPAVVPLISQELGVRVEVLHLQQ